MGMALKQAGLYGKYALSACLIRKRTAFKYRYLLAKQLIAYRRQPEEALNDLQPLLQRQIVSGISFG